MKPKILDWLDHEVMLLVYPCLFVRFGCFHGRNGPIVRSLSELAPPLLPMFVLSVFLHLLILWCAFLSPSLCGLSLYLDQYVQVAL